MKNFFTVATGRQSLAGQCEFCFRSAVHTFEVREGSVTVPVANKGVSPEQSKNFSLSTGTVSLATGTVALPSLLDYCEPCVRKLYSLGEDNELARFPLPRAEPWEINAQRFAEMREACR